jgi:hypothetical protein
MIHLAVPENLDPQISANEILAHMERVLASPFFKNSKRHTRFLRYIVEKTLSGQSDDIKERSIGIAVFDRAANYDLANDAIVRVAAAEIRKRLAQYYVNDAHAGELRIELTSGSYVPVFLPPGRTDASAPPPPTELPEISKSASLIPQEENPTVSDESSQIDLKNRYRLRFVIWSGTVAVFVLLCALLAYQHRPGQPLAEFWNPIFASDQVNVCIGDLNWIMADSADSSTEPLNQVMLRRNHVGPYDVGALATLTAYLGQHSRRIATFLADSTSLTDLRAQPSVFIGAFDNQWTQRILSSSRFQIKIDSATHIGTVVDSQSSKSQSWAINMALPLSAISRDYAVVARVNSTLTGQADLIIAGIGPYGTTAASEFVTNPKYFREFASQAPTGWEKKDVEIVLSTDVVNGRSAPPNMIAFDVR